MDRNKLLSRFIALHGVRNSKLEDLHTGVTPSSMTGDFSDVKVITPFGEIPWSKVSCISDPEMRDLMLDIERKIELALSTIAKLEKQAGSQDTFDKIVEEALFNNGGASWDDPNHKKT